MFFLAGTSGAVAVGASAINEHNKLRQSQQDADLLSKGLIRAPNDDDLRFKLRYLPKERQDELIRQAHARFEAQEKHVKGRLMLRNYKDANEPRGKNGYRFYDSRNSWPTAWMESCWFNYSDSWVNHGYHSKESQK